MDSALHLLGIARKAGRAEVGEEPAGAACRARQAKLLLVAADAAENSVRRAAHFAEAGKTPWLKAPWGKGELGGAVGRSACAMLALTDAGLAAALAEKLARTDPETYGGAAESCRQSRPDPPAAEGAAGPREEAGAGRPQALGAPAEAGRSRRPVSQKAGGGPQEKEDAMKRREQSMTRWVCSNKKG